MMAPSEAAIEKAVDALIKSPGVFQRLAEDFVEIEFPTLFPMLTPRGRNARDVAIKGWPDISCGGNVSEATMSSNWRSHLQSDMRRAAAPALNGFVFVCWAKEPPEAELRDLISQVSAASSVPTNSVHLIFRERLRRSLRKPRFAKQWLELLHLPLSPYPFVLVNSVDVPGDPSNFLFGSLGDKTSFLPTRAEYQANKVHHPLAVSVVAGALSEHGFALVRGRGASGKSTLAMSLALMDSHLSATVYYLDNLDALGSAGVAAQATVQTIASFGDRNVLFIVDNVHLNERAAAEVLRSWQELQNGSQLLFLGRIRGSYADPRRDAPVLADIAAFELAVTPQDILGVYRRVSGWLGERRDPPESVLLEWFELFQGDLVAFSAAAHRRRQDLLHRRWKLVPQDAADYVRSAYLAGLSPSEYQNLLRLSLTFANERPLPDEATIDEDFEVSVRRGIVHETHLSRRTGRRSYALVHAGIGQLILAAAGVQDAQPLRRQLAECSPQIGLHFAEWLQRQDREMEAQELYACVWTESGWPRKVTNLDGLVSEAKQIRAYKAITLEDLCARISADTDNLEKILLNTAVANFVSNFERLQEEKSPLYPLICAQLLERRTLDQFVEILENAPPHFAINILGLLGHDPMHAQARSYVADKLYAPGFTTRMEVALEAADLTLLTGVLRFLSTYNRRALRELRQYLSKPDNILLLVEKAYRTSPQGFLSFLRERRLATPVVPQIELSRWEEAQLGKVTSPDFVCALETALWRVQATRLASAPARSLIRSPTPSRWAPMQISFAQAQATLRLGKEEPLNEFVEFVAIALAGSGFLARCTASEVYWICSYLIHKALDSGENPRKALLQCRILSYASSAYKAADGDIINQAGALALVGLCDWLGDRSPEESSLPLIRDYWEEVLWLHEEFKVGVDPHLDTAFYLRGAARLNLEWMSRGLSARIDSMAGALTSSLHGTKSLDQVLEILRI